MNFISRVTAFLDTVLDTLYPVRLCHSGEEVPDFNSIREELLDLIQCNVTSFNGNPVTAADGFMNFLPEARRLLDQDIRAIFHGDPAAVDETEIIITYPGFYAIAAYRLAHKLLELGIPLMPRIITETAHNRTGIDIHPGATIGHSICIDHGTGVVIGETTVIGNNVKIYQGVTLGALSVQGRCVLGQRHPTIEDNVTIYAQATILGGETVIGRNSIIGGNVWLTKSVPPNSKIYYVDRGNTITKHKPAEK